MTKVTAKCPKKATGEGENKVTPEASVEYDFGTDLASASSLFTEEVVFSMFQRQATVAIQAVVRGAMEDGKDQKGIEAEVGAYKLGEKRARTVVDPMTAMSNMLSSASPEEAKALLKKLQAAAQG